MKVSRALLLLFTVFIVGCAEIEAPRPTVAQAPPPALQKIWNNPELLLKQAKEYYQSAQYNFSLTALRRILEAFPKSGVYEEAKILAKEVQNRLGLAGAKIGVLLPLSGPYSRYGEAALHGIECALGIFDPCGGTSQDVQIVIKDTQGSPSLAAQMVSQLAGQEKVAAIIGPLLSAETDMAAVQAETSNVPMILLSPKKRETSGHFVFQHSLFAEEEVKGLVHKVTQQGLNKFIVLYPKNRYGQLYLKLFSSELRNKGGVVVSEFGYSPDIPDFLGILQQYMKTPVVENALSKNTDGRLGIFIPDSYRQVPRIAQALDKLSISIPRLVGTSRWHHTQLLNLRFNSLERAIFDTPFNPDANREATQHFSNSYSQAYGNEPAWLEAISYDAARLVLQAIQKTGNNYPPDIRNALWNIKGFPGVVGQLSWDRSGSSRWPLDFLTIRNGEFVPL